MPFPTQVIVTLDKEGSFSAPPKSEEFREKMMAALKDYFCEKLEEEPWSDVEATLWYVVQQIPLALLVAPVALLVALLGDHWTPGAMPLEVADE